MSLSRIKAVLQVETEIDDVTNTTMETHGPNGKLLELSAGLYSFVLSRVALSTATGFSPSSSLAYFFACYQMAHLGGDVMRTQANQKTLPNYFLLAEGQIGFGLLALTSLLEGNSLSFLLAADGAIAYALVTTIYNDAKLATATNEIFENVNQITRNAVNGVLGFFHRKQPVQDMNVGPNLLVIKKNN